MDTSADDEDVFTKPNDSPERERARRMKPCWSIDFDELPLIRDIQVPEQFMINVSREINEDGNLPGCGRARGRGFRSSKNATNFLASSKNIAYDVEKVNGTAHRNTAIKYHSDQFKDSESDSGFIEENGENNLKFKPVLSLSNVVLTKNEYSKTEERLPFSFTINYPKKLSNLNFPPLEPAQASPPRAALKQKKIKPVVGSLKSLSENLFKSTHEQEKSTVSSTEQEKSTVSSTEQEKSTVSSTEVSENKNVSIDECKIFIDGLRKDVTVDQLKKYLSDFGEVSSIDLIPNDEVTTAVIRIKSSACEWVISCLDGQCEPSLGDSELTSGYTGEAS